MPIPIPTLEKSLAWVRRAEALLAAAVVEEQDPREVFRAADDLVTTVAWSDHFEARCRAGYALIRVLEAAAPGPNRNAIEQAVAGVRYEYPRGAEPTQKPKAEAGGAAKRARRGQQPPAAVVEGTSAERTTPPVTIN